MPPSGPDAGPQARIPLSCFIITRDEGDRIERCIRSIQDVADEIIVVDSGSTDDTVAKAEALGAKVFFREWDGFGPQKRFAEEQVEHDWVLNLDADEEATPELRAELKTLLKSEPACAAYKLRLVTVYPGKDKPRPFADDHNAVRLYDLRKIRYRNSLVHDRPETGQHPVGQLEAPALHFSARSLAHMRAKYDSYTDLQAKEIRKPRWQLLARLPLEYPLAFLRSYLGRRNVTGGLTGVQVAHIYAASRLQRLIKMLRRFEVEEPTRLTLQHILFSFVVGILAVVLAAAYVWRGDIQQAFLDPGVPFLTYEPPPAPNYDDAAAWALLPKPGAPETADVFFIHPTTFDGGRHWNAPIENRDARRLLERVMLPNYAGPFQRIGRVFAPHYRQANLYSHLTSREDAREARSFAYEDIREAFRHYLDTYDSGRPLVIAGVEQGNFLAQRLVRDEIATDPGLMARLAAVYLIDAAVSADFAPVPACARRDQAGCVVAWIAAVEGEPDHLRDRLRHSLVWTGGRGRPFGERTPICVNPLTGAVNGAASERAHLGGVDASRLNSDDRPAFLAHEVAARCEDGVLRVTRPSSPSLRRSGSWIESVRARPFNLFYADIEADALARLEALRRSPRVLQRPPGAPVE